MEFKMTRVREVEPGSEEMPDYKSPANRLVHSLRKGYDNLRVKMMEARKRIKYYQIKVRDLEISRDKYKQELKTLEIENERLENESKEFKKTGRGSGENLKKKT